MVLELFFLLLPLAALSGWLLGRRDKAAPSKTFSYLSADYFKGLNYLLNEQSDKAVDVFIHMLEVDSDTVETHFAIGTLFRKRGEVDRAIRIHQNLIARPTLNHQQKERVLYELGMDYMRAGLLDRAESLFSQLLRESTHYLEKALRQLLDIHQQTRDWQKAVAVAKRLQGMGQENMAANIAHFLCELAEQALQQGDPADAARLMRRALKENPQSVRVSLMESRLALSKGEHAMAIRWLQRVEKQQPAYLPEILSPLVEAHERLGKVDEMIVYLRTLLARHGGVPILLVLSELLRVHRGDDEARSLLVDYLRQHPSVQGISYLVSCRLDELAGKDAEEWKVLRELLNSLLETRPAYLCSQCGYSGKTLEWQCPSCRQWGTIKPLRGDEGE